MAFLSELHVYLIFCVSVFYLRIHTYPTHTDASHFEFLSQPDPYYYTLPDTVLIIPCHVQEILADDTRQTISSTVFVDSFRITAVNGIPQVPSDRFHILPDGVGNMIGLVIRDLDVEPVPSFVRCSVVREGREVCNTGNSTIIIGGECA